MSEADIKFSIRSDVSLVPFVGRALSALVANTGMPASRISTFELAVVEVVTNSIEHAYNYQPENKVDLYVTLSDKTIEVEVRDYGEPLSPDVIARYTNVAPEIAVPDISNIEDLPESGWGTSLVATLCDDVRYEHVDSANVLTLVCYLDESKELLETGS